MAKVTPTAKKLLLGREIAYLRDRAGLSQSEAAALIEKRQSQFTALESGQASITPGDLRLLLGGLGVTEEQHISALLELRRGNHQRGRWTGIRSLYNEDFRTLVDLEEHCDLIRTVECEVPPGLLQCEAFTRALYSYAHTGPDLDDRVQARLARQAIYHKPEPPQAAFVISESALRRQYGPPEVMREQIDYMIALSTLPNVRLQVLPFKTRVQSASIRDGFVLLRIPSPGVAGPLEFAYTENEAELRYLDDKRTVTILDTAWARLAGAALSFDDSREFLRVVADEYC
ncbi:MULTISPECIES: Scr1 family TA system antitoxin-like transcriptional regulator [Actinoalloteichus]|uniref:DNA binding protein with helix-turn-helix domain n=1 Tax=Actinoalloteichus fjordicus TaxID=1612552 RepID=A0AAC9L7Q2_9PSEU|nr:MULTISPECIES: Scr1 family TA system antitoxin-like transcriptional regulator [Actinoalloteichus]APU12657.1 DNA binding protein with helix-turn-helix domain [Actinoalloteichus fjordicus]APU18627.1 DNA binding protein with helix-turn-helix domain [Actinoalloteichus sp. GBA129-24]